MEQAIGIYLKQARQIIRLLRNDRIMMEYSPEELAELYGLKADLELMVAKAEKRSMMFEMRKQGVCV